ncbi:MAG: hypothetical protein KF862_01665 [Chitinophagaceae bacterium]|nr:hypothetical protein [Chitinophagaceae bacterium]
MCEFVKIAGNKNGYVAQCIHCDGLEIVHGNCIIQLAELQWTSFLQYILHVRQTHPNKSSSIKTIMLDIAATEFFQMYLTGSELDELHDMLESADNELKAQKLIRSFNRTC